ncbi:MAG: FHA domain-containing protein [Actinomycetota bacterium]
MARQLTVKLGDQVLLLDPARPARVGRDQDAEVFVPDPAVSREHGVLEPTGEGWVYRDAGSTGGTFLDGERIEELAISGPVELRLAGPERGAILELDPGAADGDGGRPTPSAVTVVRIGRDGDNDVVLNDPSISRHHAEVRSIDGGSLQIADLDSTNGTFVDGRRITRAVAGDGQRVTIGQTTFSVVGGELERPDDTGTIPALQARGLTVHVGKETVLDDVTFELAPNSVLAIVGPTGSGKTTLLRALTGFRPPDEGEVAFHGHDLYASFEELRRRIGYVPQDEILHRSLTIRRALNFAAELRFPPDASKGERRGRVEEVMEELGIEDRAGVAIERVSGGQRKRTNVALELLTKPTLLFLDEPTSGLDPGFERTLMETLRDLATDGRAVIVVTHTVQSLDLCDRVLALDAHGRMVFFGKPSEIRERFGKDDFAEVFRDLLHDGNAAAQQPPMTLKPVRAPAEEPASPQIGRLRQLSMLVRRHVAIVAADRRNWLYLLAELLIPAVLIRAVAGSHALQPGTAEIVRNSRVLLGAIAVGAAVIGVANAVREIRKEMPIYLRERSIGLSRSSYLASKLIVLGLLTAIQVVILTIIATRGSGGPSDSLVLPPLAELCLDAALAGIAAVGLGLLISAFASSPEKAMALVPVIFLVEWLFSGVAMNLEGKPVLRQIGYVTSANWGVSAEAASIDLCRVARLPDPGEVSQRATEQGTPTCDWRWEHRTGRWELSLATMAGQTLVALILAAWALRRQEPGRGRRRRRRRREARRRARDPSPRPARPEVIGDTAVIPAANDGH